MTAVGGGPEFFRLVRFWSRRWTAGFISQAPEDPHCQQVMVVEAVDSAARNGGEVTVAAVAHQLGIDRSTASRMISDAVAAGCLQREESAADARRAPVSLTDQGRQVLDGSHNWQQQVFDRLIADWEPADRQRLAGYLRRLTDQTDT
ncbi:MarR family transcriptional regulator [Acrocarpospora corrugata]|uniref:MarR family transcriptional regulator n=1 Tax=Acrocarpospora corrugata TaxID=35763 RepID=A0A5M3VXW6_9ACTN|nr:MarR family winged helix-turn-helix transcriptional regulator [Acrocarpospora corrugata]GES00572.1 MarR family transcriptional regulator [Acrocarpospora corrugata]